MPFRLNDLYCVAVYMSVSMSYHDHDVILNEISAPQIELHNLRPNRKKPPQYT